MKFSVNHGIKSLLQYGEAHPAVIRGLSILWLAAIGWFAFLSRLGQIGLVDETEPLFAEAARQMTVTGDWVTPFFNGETRFDKPPLTYWLMAIAYQLVGTNEWAVRLPSALAAIALTSFGFYVLWRFGAPKPVVDSQPTLDSTTQATSQPRFPWQSELSAWLGAAMMALNPETIAWGRTGVSDMLLTGCVGAALLTFFMGYAQPGRPSTQRRWYLAFYSFLALAVLAKGPVGVVLPGLIIGLFLLYLGNWRQILPEMGLLRGSLIFLVLTVPWYLLVIQANGQAFIQSFFGYHNLERFTSVVNRHDAPWYFYTLIIAIGFAPWSIYLPAAIAQLKVWRRPYWQRQPRSAHLGLFALFWVLGIFGFFSIAVTKLPSYLLPLMPAAAILIALFWSQQITGSLNSKKQHRSLLLNGWVNILFFCVLAGGFLYSPNWLDDDATLPNLRLAVQQANLPIIGAFIWGLAALFGILLLFKRQARWLWSVNFIAVLASLIFVLTPGLVILDAERQLPLRQLAAIAVQAQRSGEELVMLGFKKPSLVFYTQQHITYLEDPRQARSYLQPIVTAPSHVNSALVIALDQDMLEAGLKPDDYQDLAEAGRYQLVRVTGPNSFISSQSI